MLYLIFVAADSGSIDRALALLSTAAFPANISFVLGHLERDSDSLDEIFVPDLEGPDRDGMPPSVLRNSTF